MLLESAFRFGAHLDAAQLMAPESLEPAGPVVHGPDGIRVGAVEHAAAVAANADQAHIAENAKVLRNRWLPDTHGRDNVSHGALVEHKQVQDFPPAWFRHGVKSVRIGGSARHNQKIYIPITEYVKRNSMLTENSYELAGNSTSHRVLNTMHSLVSPARGADRRARLW
jgi:hypothetical protein